MSDLKSINDAVIDSLNILFGENDWSKMVVLEQTKKEFSGDLTLICFPFLRWSKSNPENTANIIGNHLLDSQSYFENFNVVKGFLNLKLTQSYWLDLFNKWVKDDNFGLAKEDSGKLFLVEYSSPNTNKPLHLGHVRNIFLGDSVVSLLKSVGHKVIRTQIINDRGIHICKSMIAWQRYAEGETPIESGLKGDHLVGKYYVLYDKVYKKEVLKLVSQGISEEEAKVKAPILLAAKEMLIHWENGKEEVRALWSKMNGWVYEGFSKTYSDLDVDFDKLYYESDTYELGKEVVLKGLESGVFYKKEDGSIWCDLSSEKMDDKLLIRSDGTTVYMTQDIGTAVQRFNDFSNLSGVIYTVGNEQNHHFKVLFEILNKLGFEWSSSCYHLSYGMVELPDGKMKSREGTVVDADDLLSSVVQEAKLLTGERGHLEGMNSEEVDELCNKIGKAGLKYFLLKVDPKKSMTFDPKESIDLNGHTGPYIQYGFARITSLIEKFTDFQDFDSSAFKLSSKELEVIKVLSLFPGNLIHAAKEFSPSILANYLFGLVKVYNSFYQDSPVIKEENEELRSFRVQLSSLTASVIKKGMNILGIQMPRRM
jgi:arginyl-tRNA synthetase